MWVRIAASHHVSTVLKYLNVADPFNPGKFVNLIDPYIHDFFYLPTLHFSQR